MASRYYDNRGKREWWSVHVEAWERSGLSQVKYCTVHGLERGTFARWLNVLTDAKIAKLRVERVALERKRARNKKGRKLTTNRRNRAAEALWAMYVDALNWSGMSVMEYAKALRISQFSLRRWRDLIADEELVIDWRAQLHASARPQISSGAKRRGQIRQLHMTSALHNFLTKAACQDPPHYQSFAKIQASVRFAPILGHLVCIRSPFRNSPILIGAISSTEVLAWLDCCFR